jgi:hypothetical protein
MAPTAHSLPIPNAQTAVRCPACTGTTFRSYWFGPPTDRVVRLTCGNDSCGKAYRDLTADTPFLIEPRAADAHRHEMLVPPASWRWLGYLRGNDNLWRPIAEASTLGGAWDAVQTTWQAGDILIMPVRPRMAAGAEHNDGNQGDTSEDNGLGAPSLN